MLENRQRKEGVGVEVRQHQPKGVQHGVEEERNWRDHTRHDEAQENPRVPRPMPSDLAGVGNGGAAFLIRLIRDVGSEPLVPPLLPSPSKGIKGS
jgi:hypothetical protein